MYICIYVYTYIYIPVYLLCKVTKTHYVENLYMYMC